jgi:hypothetical protein
VTPRATGDRDPGQGCQDQQPGPVTRDTDPGRRDKDLTSGDRDERAIQRANEPPYDCAPAAAPSPYGTRWSPGLGQAVQPAQGPGRPTDSSALARRHATAIRDTTNEQTNHQEAISTVWTVEAVRRLGLTTDIETAGSILGIGRTKAYELARAGNFPVKVLRNGRKYLVAVPAILRALDVD